MSLENVLHPGKIIKEVPAERSGVLRIISFDDTEGGAQKVVSKVRIEHVSAGGEILSVRAVFTKKEWSALRK